jgi:glycosyltransferase involved in cell wall biosynthesis
MTGSCVTPAVLVGIVTHNRASILPKAIQSALSQSYSNLNVTVLDDGSSDETSALQSDFPAVKWQKWESSRGYLDARNHLMRTASADYYLSLDDDAWFLEGDEVAVAIAYMEGNPRVECGFYAPSPGLYGSEEKDLCLRLLDGHWDIHQLPGVHVWHDKTALARDQAAQHRSGVCNDLVFALRRCPLPLMLAILPAKMMSHLRFAVRRHLLRPCVEGFGLFLRHALAVWQSRNPVRRETFAEFLRRSRAA